MKKSIFTALFVVALAPFFYNPFQTNVQASDSIEWQIDVDDIEGKKGRVTGQSSNRFVVTSDDGNTYSTPKEPGYGVNDLVYHSRPIGGWVTLLGHQ